MSSGFHGENGLDPASSLHIFKLHVLPILLYGLEVMIPTGKLLKNLEMFQKKLLKQILSIPPNSADMAVYILSGVLPIQAQLDKRVLTMFNNVCLQSDSAVEKKLAIRQLTVKNDASHSWFIQVKHILWKYELGDPLTHLADPLSSTKWKKNVHTAVDNYWKADILDMCQYYKTISNMNTSLFKPGKPHPILCVPVKSARDAARYPVQLKLITGTYVLQSNRSAFNKSEVDPTCKLCEQSDETLEHFILQCPELSGRRDPILNDINCELVSLGQPVLEAMLPCDRIKLLIDPTHIVTWNNLKFKDVKKLEDLEFQCKRLLYFLHNDRYSILKKWSMK